MLGRPSRAKLLGETFSKLFRYGVALVVGYAIGHWAAAAKFDPSLIEVTTSNTEQPAEGQSDEIQTTVQEPEPSTPAPAPERWDSGNLRGVTPQGASIDGQAVPLGTPYQGSHVLLAVDTQSGQTYWIDRMGLTWIWPVGGVARPGLLPAELRRAYSQQQYRASDSPDASTTTTGQDSTLDTP